MRCQDDSFSNVLVAPAFPSLISEISDDERKKCDQMHVPLSVAVSVTMSRKSKLERGTVTLAAPLRRFASIANDKTH